MRTYILGKCGIVNDPNNYAYGFNESSRSSNNKIWLESVNLVNSGSDTIVNFNFQQEFTTGDLGSIKVLLICWIILIYRIIFII
jgi:hypothetical protein